MLLHVLLGAEHQCASRAGLDAGRLESDGDPVRAQRALVRFVVSLRDARYVERASSDAIAAADAVRLVEIDYAVGVLHDRARRGAGFELSLIHISEPTRLL